MFSCWQTYIYFITNDNKISHRCNPITKFVSVTKQPRFDYRQRKFFLFAGTTSRPDQAPTQLRNERGPEALFAEVRRMGREGDHSPPSSNEQRGQERMELYVHAEHVLMSW